jgi:hypothetical protein
MPRVRGKFGCERRAAGFVVPELHCALSRERGAGPIARAVFGRGTGVEPAVATPHTLHNSSPMPWLSISVNARQLCGNRS